MFDGLFIHYKEYNFTVTYIQSHHIMNIIIHISISLKVAPYKKIRRVAFINAIPKSPAGKILRRELVNHALSLPKL